MKDFFISYNKADKAWAEWIAWVLEEANYATVLEAWDFRPGSNFALDMDKAAREAERTITVLSPDFVTALYTQPEWAAAFARDPTGEKGILVPVLVRECDLEGLLAQIVYVKLVGLNETEARTALLDGVKQGRAKPPAPPPFPLAVEPVARSVTVKPLFPGIWNVPHHRNRNFTGREEILSDLRSLLTSGSSAALTQAITGLGGVGKTSLALEYVYRYRAEYSVVWWLPSEESAKLTIEYAGLAKALDLPIKDSPNMPEIIRAVRRWLDQNSGWLLVFDNAGSPDELGEFRPQGETGHVIITSRNQNWGTAAKPLTVQVWPRDEAADFLLKRTGQDDRTAASELAEELGCLPLALEHAGAYIETRVCSINDYLQRFRERGPELLEHVKPSAEYPLTVVATWKISFEQVRKESPEAADLIKLLAFFAPDDIPREILCDGASQLPEPLAGAVCDRLGLDDILAILRGYSLADVQPEGLSVHRLVQAVTRDLISDEEKGTWAEAAVKLLSAIYPFHQHDLATWRLSERLLPHGIAAADHADKLSAAGPETALVLKHIGTHLLWVASLHEARRALERALNIAEAVFGPDHINVAFVLNQLGAVHRDLADYQGAKAFCERALSIFKATCGTDHPNVGGELANFASMVHHTGDLQGARKIFDQALSISEEGLGPSHPQVADILSSFAGLLRDLDDLQGAKNMLERALTIDIDAYGTDHLKVAIRLTNLGLVLKDLGELERAREMIERALSISEAWLGSDHPGLAIPLGNLGLVLGDLGDVDAARACLSRALEINRKALGEEHPSTKLARENLAAVDEDQ